MKRETLTRLWEALEDALVAVEAGLFELETEGLRIDGPPTSVEEQVATLRHFEAVLLFLKATPNADNREQLRKATRAVFETLARRPNPSAPVRLGQTIYAIDPARGALHRYEPSEIPDLRGLVAQSA